MGDLVRFQGRRPRFGHPIRCDASAIAVLGLLAVLTCLWLRMVWGALLWVLR